MKHYNDDFFNHFVDGQVDLASRQEFLSHIETCEACAKEYNLLLKAHNGFSLIELEEAPLSINSFVMRRIAKVVRPSEGSKKFFIGMLITLTSLLLILFGYALNSGSGTSAADQKPLIDFSKIDFSFMKDLSKPLGSFTSIFTPDFGGMLMILAISVASYFIIEKLKEGKH
ncbi:MAG: hypothetical protein J0L60_07670 [Ignavibacteria bacterium]|nr:hypothetical protein [Ignavibacteria bacterium]